MRKKTMRPEVVEVLMREKSASEMAIARLQEKIRPLESRYGWTTEEFLEKFEKGEAGDEQDYFLWYALAEAIEDWKRTRDGLVELLDDAEKVSV